MHVTENSEEPPLAVNVAADANRAARNQTDPALDDPNRREIHFFVTSRAAVFVYTLCRTNAKIRIIILNRQAELD